MSNRRTASPASKQALNTEELHRESGNPSASKKDRHRNAQ